MENSRNIIVALLIIVLFIIVSLLEKRETFQESIEPDKHEQIQNFMQKLVEMRANVNSKEANNEIKLRLEQLEQYLKLIEENKSSSNITKINEERDKSYVVLKCSPNVTPIMPINESELEENDAKTKKLLKKIYAEIDKIQSIHNFSPNATSSSSSSSSSTTTGTVGTTTGTVGTTTGN